MIRLCRVDQSDGLARLSFSIDVRVVVVLRHDETGYWSPGEREMSVYNDLIVGRIGGGFGILLFSLGLARAYGNGDQNCSHSAVGNSHMRWLRFVRL